MTGRRRNPIRTLFKVETLTPNSVIVVKAGTAMNTEKNMKALAQELVKKGLTGIIILTLADLNDFHSISEEQMNRLGWIKKPKEEIVVTPNPA